MKILSLRAKALLVILCLFIFSERALAERAVPVQVVVNKGTVITVKEPCKRVSLSSPEIADLSLISPQEVLVNGKKVGATTLIIWDMRDKPNFFDIVVRGDLDQLMVYIKETAPNDDITAEIANDSIVLSGTASNRQTVNKIVQMAQAYAVGSEITSTTKYSQGMTEVENKSSGKVINHIRIEDEQQVVLEVKVAQIDKTKLKDLGVSTLIKGHSAEGFTNLVGAPSGSVDTQNFVDGLARTHAEGIAGNMPGLASITPLDAYQIGVSYFPAGIGAVLKALENKSLAKILAEPNLVVRSGEKGDFHVGTRYPVQVVVGTGAAASVSIQYEEIGIRLNFAPEILETGAIRLKIDPAEVSNIIDYVKTSLVVAPIIDTRTVRTSVDLREGESLILAGLLDQETKKNIQKIPILADIPILGAIFRSTSDELTRNELAFFITPKIVKPLPKGSVRPELPGEKPLTRDEEKEFQWLPWGK